MKVSKFSKLALLLAMMIASVFLLTQVSLAQVLSIAPPTISLGSVKPGDTVERKKRVLIRLFKEIDVEKVRVTPVEEKGFILELEGKGRGEISASYSCKKISCNEKAGTIRIEVTIEVTEIKWEYPAGKYTGKITITLSESS